MPSSKKYSIGVDIGGTKMSSVLVVDGKTISDFTLATPKDSLDHFMIMLKALVDPLLLKAEGEKAKVPIIGIGIPGMLDSGREKILKCPNLPLLNGVRLPALLKAKFGFDIVMDNDANCFVRAEAALGAGRLYKNVYGITIGTGIGGGWWFDGDIYGGAHGGGAEPGHMVIDYQTPLDLEDAYHRLTGKDPAQVAERAYRGDMLAEKTFEEIGRLLGAGLANIVNLIDPDIIVIGGGVAESSALFLETAKKTMKGLVVSPASKNVKVVKARLGQLAGAIGAGLLR